MKNNLFYYATSELSQDAFICWLCSFAFKDNSDPVLHNCAQQLLRLFVPELATADIALLDVERQVGRVDVLLTLSAGEKIYKVVVEDKTFTSEHDNQLLRYLEQIESAYPECVAKGVYYKTGFQCDLSTVIDAEYTIISREQMLSFMTPYASQTQNQIFLDYYRYWNSFQKDVEKYQSLPVSQWDWKQVNGFYDSLHASRYFEKHNLWMGYGYVANQTGGFHGLWFGANDCCVNINGIPFELFLQLETVTGNPSSAQLCLKFCAKEDIVDREALSHCRDQVVYDDNWNYTLKEYHFCKPRRLARGRHMTIGVYVCEINDHRELLNSFEAAIQDYNRLLSSFR